MGPQHHATLRDRDAAPPLRPIGADASMWAGGLLLVVGPAYPTTRPRPHAATKDTIQAQLRKRIFGPLGLRSTVLATSQRIGGAHAHGYLVQGKTSCRT